MSFDAIPSFRPGELREKAASLDPRPLHGRVTAALGPIVKAVVPDAFVGELVHLAMPAAGRLSAEIIGLDGPTAVIAPIGETKGVTVGSAVYRTRASLQVPVGPALLGRVLNGLGQPLDEDSAGPLRVETLRPSESPPMPALHRGLMKDPLPFGIRAIDGLLTCSEGQRIGIFGEPGSGKSVLLGQIVRGATVDVVVAGLIGERGREVSEFIERQLPARARARSVLVVATSDRPALERMRAAHTATAIAEGFRDAGLKVLLVIDSITRFARAMREVGLAAGEPPTRRGFPPSVMAQLPQLLERPGLSSPSRSGQAAGSITAVYTVLVEGDGTDDPIAEETRSLLDGHVVLSPKLAASGQYPAIDVVRSRSRVMDSVIASGHRAAAERVRTLMHKHQETEFLVQVGEYKAGADRLTDEALAKADDIRAFLKQETNEIAPFHETLQRLSRLAAP